MRVLALLLSVVALALAGHSAARVAQVSRESARFRQEMRSELAARTLRGGAEPGVDYLAAAREHARRARAYIDRRDLQSARKELDASLNSLEQADRAAGQGGGRRLDELERTWGSIRQQADKLWKQFAEETRKKETKRDATSR